MNTNPDDWWLRRRHPSVSPGDAWSGGGAAYRAWMGAKPARSRSAPAPPRVGRAASSTGREFQPSPRAAIRRTGRFDPIAEALLLLFTGIPLALLRRRVRLRLLFALGAAGFAAIVFLAPLAWAGRLDPCAAAEEALVDEAIDGGSRLEDSKRRVANWAGQDGKLLSRGAAGRRIAAERYAGWPPVLGCSALFWRARWDAASFGGFTPVLSRVLAARR